MRRIGMVIGMAALASLAIAVPAAALPQLSLSSTSASLGETAAIHLRIDGAEEPCIGVNAKFSLPPGVSLVSTAPGELLSDQFTIDSYDFTEPPNVHSVLAYTITDSFDAASGVLFTFTVQVSNDPADVGLDSAASVVGQIELLASGLASIDGETSIPHTRVNGMMSLTLAPQPFLVVRPTSQVFSSAGGQASLVVTNNGYADMPWTASVLESPAWLNIASAANGLNNGTIVLYCATNTLETSRTASVLIDAGQVPGSPAAVTVTQAGETSPVLRVTPVEVNVPPTSGTVTLGVANIGHGAMAWSARVVAGLDWLDITGGASGANLGTVSLTYMPNTTEVARRGAVEVRAQGALGSPVIVTVTQQAPSLLSVTPVEATAPAAGGSVQFQVANRGSGEMTWTANVVSGVDWLTITSGSNGTNGGTISLSCVANTAANARTGSVRIEALGVLGSPVTVHVTQAGNTRPLLSVSPVTQTVNADATAAEFIVSNLGHGTLRWVTTVLEGAEWVSITAGTSGTDTGAIRLSFTSTNAAAERHARLRVDAPGADGSPAEVTLVQRGAEPLQVTAPNGGENWLRGDPYTITWRVVAAKSIESVSIILLKGGNVVSSIALTTHNTGSHQWTIPPDLEAADDYQIQVVDVTNPAVHDESDGPFAVNCPPEPPSNVQATHSYRTLVRVTWDAVDAALEYQVYRSTTGIQEDAVLVATVTTPSYEDRDVSRREWSFFSCKLRHPLNTYTYWIKAVNDCDAVEFSASAEGSCSFRYAAGKSADLPVWEKVLPHPSEAGEEAAVPSDSTLAIRLRSEEQIDPTTVWADIEGSAAPKGIVHWLPADTEKTADGWALITPNGHWTLGDTVTITAGARTYASSVVGPITYTFHIEPADAGPPQADETDNLAWQPTYDDLDTSAFDLEREGNASVTVRINNANGAPLLADGIGEPYVLSPNQVFEVPQRVWLPVPQGEDVGNVSVLYYYSGSGEPGWYPAENVEGWLVPDSLVSAEFGGVTYLGFLVRHGGTVQLGGVPETAEPDSGSASALSALGENPGDLAILGLLLLIPGGISRVRRRVSVVLKNSRS